MLKFIIITCLFTGIFFIPQILTAEDKVVVIPLMRSTDIAGTDGQFIYNKSGQAAGAPVTYSEETDQINVTTSQVRITAPTPHLVLEDAGSSNDWPSVTFLNNHAVFQSDDGRADGEQYFNFYSKFSSYRENNSHVRIFGATGMITSWGHYLELTHENGHGKISTDTGNINLVPSPYGLGLFDGRVGIDTQSPSRKLEVNGGIHANGIITWEPTESYLQFSGRSFVDNSRNPQPGQVIANPYFRYLVASVQLPMGAVITKIAGRWLDQDSNYNQTMQLRRLTTDFALHIMGDDEIIASVSSHGNNFSGAEYQFDLTGVPPDDLKINNEWYCYDIMFEIPFSCSGSSCTEYEDSYNSYYLYSALITYTTNGIARNTVDPPSE